MLAACVPRTGMHGGPRFTLQFMICRSLRADYLYLYFSLATVGLTLQRLVVERHCVGCEARIPAADGPFIRALQHARHRAPLVCFLFEPYSNPRPTLAPTPLFALRSYSVVRTQLQPDG